jgi:hypothetical protein
MGWLEIQLHRANFFERTRGREKLEMKKKLVKLPFKAIFLTLLFLVKPFSLNE